MHQEVPLDLLAALLLVWGAMPVLELVFIAVLVQSC